MNPYAKSELPNDDLGFLRDMIEQPSNSSESIDFQFLQKELIKRRPQPVKPKKGIEIIEPQTKPSIRKPNYLKSPLIQTISKLNNTPKSNIRDITYTFPDTNEGAKSNTAAKPLEISKCPQTKSTISQAKYEQNNLQNTPNSDTTPIERNGPKQPKSYLSWKFIGDTVDGNFGILTGKINARETPTTLKRNFANIPYVLDQYHIEFPNEEQEEAQKVRPRDLFALSINKNRTNDFKNSRTISRLQQQKRKQKFSSYDYQSEPDTQLYLETDDKLIPLVASHLPKGNQI